MGFPDAVSAIVSRANRCEVLTIEAEDAVIAALKAKHEHPEAVIAYVRKSGFRDVRVERATREGSFESFEDYWDPIEAGVGSMPQAYLRLSAEDRRAVRDEVRSRLSRFESNGKLRLSVEMLIGSGRV